MTHTTRRQALGTLGGLLAALALFLVPGSSALAALRKPAATPRTSAPAKGEAPVVRPPQHSVSRQG